MTPRFKPGDLVSIVPHRIDREGEPTIHTLARVVNPCRPTDMVRVTGEPVRFYVDVEILDRPGKLHAFHEASLEPAP